MRINLVQSVLGKEHSKQKKQEAPSSRKWQKLEEGGPMRCHIMLQDLKNV